MAAPVVEAVATNFQSVGTSADITIDKPTGTAVGDVLIAIVAIHANTSWSGPDASWVSSRSEDQGVNGAAVVTSSVYVHEVDGTEGANFTFTPNSAGRQTGVILRISGADASAIVNVSNAASAQTTATITAPDVTTTVDDTLVLRVFHGTDGLNAHSTPTNHTEHADVATTFGAGLTTSVSSITAATAGAVGTAASTASPNTPEAVLAQTIAITPAEVTEWTFRLTVTDNDGATDTYDLVVPIGIPETPDSPWMMWDGTQLVAVTPHVPSVVGLHTVDGGLMTTVSGEPIDLV